MNQAQKNLLIELSRNERRNLHKKLTNFYIDVNKRDEIKKEIALLTLTINQLKGGK